MDIREVLEFAVDQEREAERFYASVAGKMANPAVKELFLDLSREEGEHAALLRRWLASGRTEAMFRSSGPDFRLAEAVARPQLSAAMKPADALALAMKREMEAGDFYAELAAEAVAAPERLALEDLAAMERGHKRRLEEAFASIGYPEAF